MDLQIGTIYNVRVIKLESFGAIVEMDDRSTSLIHISNIADAYVSSVGDYLSIDDRLQAEGVAGKVKPVELSLKYLNLKPVYASSTTYHDHDARKEHIKSDKSSIHTDYNTSHRKSNKRSYNQNNSNLDRMIADSYSAFDDKFGINARQSDRVTRHKKRR